MKKIHVIVRSDIAPGLQLAQACHALQAMNDQHPSTISEWEGNIAIVAARDQEHLATLASDLMRARKPIALFCEPDLGGALTAACVAHAGPELSQLPLALKAAVTGRP